MKREIISLDDKPVEEQSRFGPKEENGYDEEDCVRQDGQNGVPRPIEEKPYCRRSGHRENRYVPPSPKKYIGDCANETN